MTPKKDSFLDMGKKIKKLKKNIEDLGQYVTDLGEDHRVMELIWEEEKQVCGRDKWRCRSCIFFEEETETMGFCRRSPPKVIPPNNSDYNSHFPAINSNNWCGKFIARTEEEES